MRKLINNIAHGVFTVGGFSVIFIVALMLLFLTKEVVPLFYSASVADRWEEVRVDTDVIEKPIYNILSENGSLVLLIYDNGEITLEKTGVKKRNEMGEEITEYVEWGDEEEGLEDITHVLDLDLGYPVEKCYYENGVLAVTSPGVFHAYRLKFERDPNTGLEAYASLKLINEYDIPFETTDHIAVNQLGDENQIFAVSSGSEVYYHILLGEEFLGEIFYDDWTTTLDIDTDGGEIVAMTFYSEDDLLVFLKNGEVLKYNDEGDEGSGFDVGFRVKTVSRLIGGRGILVGGYDGEIGVWTKSNTQPVIGYTKIHKFKHMPGAIEGFTVSGRDRSFLAWDSQGNVWNYFSTTEKLIIRLNELSEGRNFRYSFNSKGTMLMGITPDNERKFVAINQHHPDVTFGSLFGPVNYEGYGKATFAWQSTGGSQEFEPKFSLIPLILGTIKGAVYAMLFALPLAIAGALFLNQFIHPSLHKFIKPVIEIMAGLPSVIIGFLAGLWLAPLLEKTLPGVLLGCLVVPLVVIGIAVVLEKMRVTSFIDSYKWGIFLLIPAIFIVFYGCVKLTPFMNWAMFGGDFRQWIFDVLGTPYDQRNATVVGFAMGFAVIPNIFSLAEDALSFVPRETIAGSLALGLSRWQTATGVAFKAAIPGIISATMIGFGRAVGETMIVLMATGNTPVLTFFPFNGFRTLSANIAVELPEAPVGGSAYRILFLSALLLFAFTLVINIGSDMLQKRMQKGMK
jgi:ABC-type uncharacterized transport system permease subunit